MKDLIESFTAQLKRAIEIGSNAKLSKWNHSINNVLISGLGGSGIGGSLVAQLTEKECRVPIVINKGYFIPEFVNENTLFIACSYSGNTEETINSLNLAIEKGAKIICITSGGKIKEIALELGIDLILIPSGMPPRACLGYSLVQLFTALEHFKLITGNFKQDFQAAIELLDQEEKFIQIEAKLVANKLKDKLPVIYSAALTEAVSIRFRQQLNENSKILCWHHAFPEMNHNELVGWRDRADHVCVVLLRNENDYSRTKLRMEIAKREFEKYTENIVEIFSKGKSAIETAMYLVHLTDYVSVFLAELRGVDAVEVKVIDHLKSELAKA